MSTYNSEPSFFGSSPPLSLYVGNPFPGREVVTFKLSSRQMPEVVDGPQGNKVVRNVQLETVFEMNYTTGTWRKLQVKRVIE